VQNEAGKAFQILEPIDGHARKANETQTISSEIKNEISCRVTRTLLMYVRENNGGTLGSLLDGLPLDERYLSDANNWVSHALLQVALYTYDCAVGG
jgi:hypothetical protein